MLRRWPGVLMGVTLLSVAPASGREPCQERTLSLRYAPQAGGSHYWCWAASGQMIMELLGEEPDRACQCRQAENVLGVEGCCLSTLSCLPAASVPARCDEPRWPAFAEQPSIYAFDYKTTCDGLPGARTTRLATRSPSPGAISRPRSARDVR